MADGTFFNYHVASEGVFLQIIRRDDFLQQLRGLHFAERVMGELDGKSVGGVSTWTAAQHDYQYCHPDQAD